MLRRIAIRFVNWCRQTKIDFLARRQQDSLQARAWRRSPEYLQYLDVQLRRTLSKKDAPLPARARALIDKVAASTDLSRCEVLCIGARNRAEIDYFKHKGAKSVTGIDLYAERRDERSHAERGNENNENNESKENNEESVEGRRRGGYAHAQRLGVPRSEVPSGSGQDGRILVMDMHQMSFPDNRFDLVYSSHSLEHAYEPRQVVSEIVRVSRPGALVVIEVPVQYEVRGADRLDFGDCHNLHSYFRPYLHEVLWCEGPQEPQPPEEGAYKIIRTMFSISK